MITRGTTKREEKNHLAKKSVQTIPTAFMAKRTRNKDKTIFNEALEESNKKGKLRYVFKPTESDIVSIEVSDGEMMEAKNEVEEKSLVGRVKKRASLAEEFDKMERPSNGQKVAGPVAEGPSFKRVKRRAIKVQKVKKVLKGKVIDPTVAEEPGLNELKKKVDCQGWSHLLFDPHPVVHEDEICQFYKRFKLVKGDTVETTVKGVKISFTDKDLGDILRVPTIGCGEYVKRGWIEYGPEKSRVYLTTKFTEGSHALPYGIWLTRVFTHFKVPLNIGKRGGKKDMINRSTLAECDLLPRALGFKSNSLITQLINELEEAKAEKAKAEAENIVLKSEIQKVRFWLITKGCSCNI
ncbi:hypothetical protein EJD97_015328 [Solanum chilense]|uniref:Uncharacterized protein n=1 Tax=Solanum chilense TaxID=4083 RepID=A0A6N2C7I1_SOLCI|nr:hypothetical protein EJD97_015328 [Solanum chilense]